MQKLQNLLNILNCCSRKLGGVPVDKVTSCISYCRKISIFAFIKLTAIEANCFTAVSRELLGTLADVLKSLSIALMIFSAKCITIPLCSSSTNLDEKTKISTELNYIYHLSLCNNSECTDCLNRLLAITNSETLP